MPKKLTKKQLEELAKEIDNCEFHKINVDKAEKISREYKIMTIPTLLLFENGELKEKTIGLKSKSEIKKIIKQA